MKKVPEVSLVPFMDRVRGIQACRALLVFVVISSSIAFPSPGHSLRLTAWLCGAYLLATGFTLLAPRLRRSFAVGLFGLALLVDGVFLAAMTYGGLGFKSPLVGLVLLHLVAVTLLGSFRTGLKIAVWHTLMMTSTHQLQQAGTLHTPATDQRIVAATIVTLWLATLTTAAFASVNERELRRRNYDLAQLAKLSLRFEGSLQPADVAVSLISAICDDQDVDRAVLLWMADGKMQRLAGRGDEQPLAAMDAAGDHMIHTAIASHRTLRVPKLDRDRDPWLVAALPNASNLILVPFYAENTIAGLLVGEHGSRHGSRVERRVLEMLERYVSHAALALNNARLLLQVRELADSDGLTGVANRRTFDRVLAQSLAIAARQDLALSVVLVDIDHFKAVNDTYGHQVGDTTLRLVAGALAKSCRQADVVARYGGEEFAVILPGTDAEGAYVLAEKLREAVADAAEHPTVTASFGVGTTLRGMATSEWLVATADAALYRSKLEGRDRVTLGVSEQPTDADWKVSDGIPPQRDNLVTASGGIIEGLG